MRTPGLHVVSFVINLDLLLGVIYFTYVDESREVFIDSFRTK